MNWPTAIQIVQAVASKLHGGNLTKTEQCNRQKLNLEQLPCREMEVNKILPEFRRIERT